MEALIVGRGLGDDGTTADQDRKRFEALQAVYSLGELGRRYAVELAEQVGLKQLQLFCKTRKEDLVLTCLCL